LTLATKFWTSAATTGRSNARALATSDANDPLIYSYEAL